jgi:hypothetical protein
VRQTQVNDPNERAIQRKQLQNLVDFDNHPDRLQIIDSVAFVPEIVDSLSEQLCGAPLELPCCTDPMQLPSTTVAAGRYRYFSPECGVGGHALEVVLQTLSGQCLLYVSTSTSTPGPLQNEGADESGAILKRVRLEGPRTEVWKGKRRKKNGSRAMNARAFLL